MATIEQKHLERFLKELMEIERRYANELKGSKTNRQDEVRELVDRLAAEISHAD